MHISFCFITKVCIPVLFVEYFIQYPYHTFYFTHASDFLVEGRDKGKATSQPETDVQTSSALEVVILELVTLHSDKANFWTPSFAYRTVAL